MRKVDKGFAYFGVKGGYSCSLEDFDPSRTYLWFGTVFLQLTSSSTRGDNPKHNWNLLDSVQWRNGTM